MKNKVFIILGILIIIIVIVFLILKGTLSKYSSTMESDAEIDIAFYVIDSNYQVEEIKLDKLVPSNDYYTYDFNVANYNDEKMLEVNAEYNIVIRTTTNLNLEYELYKNNNPESIFTSKEIISDEDGMYYNVMKTEKENFGYIDKQINYYTLAIKFPLEYINYEYQDIMESIEIIIISSQVTE